MKPFGWLEVMRVGLIQACLGAGVGPPADAVRTRCPASI